MSSFGALGSAEINFSLLENVGSEQKIYVQYGLIASMILVIGLLYSLLCLKPGNSYYPRSSKPNKTFKELVAEAKASLKTPEIANSYSAAFLARSDSILLSLYLVLWTYSFSDPSDRSDKVYEDAFKKSSMLSGIAYFTIMLTCIIYGFYYARKDYSRSKIMIVMLVLAAVGSAALNFAKDPSSYMAITSMVVLGLGMSGLLSSSLYLVNEYSTPESRGFITGLQTWFGVVGILFQTIFGALLYEITRCGPFDYFSCTCLIVLIVTVVVYRRNKNELTNSLMGSSVLTEGEGEKGVRREEEGESVGREELMI
jgi:MFS family permease